MDYSRYFGTNLILRKIRSRIKIVLYRSLYEVIENKLKILFRISSYDNMSDTSLFFGKTNRKLGGTISK